MLHSVETNTNEALLEIEGVAYLAKTMIAELQTKLERACYEMWLANSRNSSWVEAGKRNYESAQAMEREIFWHEVNK